MFMYREKNDSLQSKTVSHLILSISILNTQHNIVCDQLYVTWKSSIQIFCYIAFAIRSNADKMLRTHVKNIVHVSMYHFTAIFFFLSLFFFLLYVTCFSVSCYPSNNNDSQIYRQANDYYHNKCDRALEKKILIQLFIFRLDSHFQNFFIYLSIKFISRNLFLLLK